LILGRRNVATKMQLDYISGKRYEAQKNIDRFKGNQYTVHSSGDPDDLGKQNKHKTSIAGRRGEIEGVSDFTIHQNQKFAKGIDVVKEVAPELAEHVPGDGTLLLSSIYHQRRRLRLLGENQYPVSQAISGGEDAEERIAARKRVSLSGGNKYAKPVTRHVEGPLPDTDFPKGESAAIIAQKAGSSNTHQVKHRPFAFQPTAPLLHSVPGWIALPQVH